jgi:predicted component of type VI protein secretion system
MGSAARRTRHSWDRVGRTALWLKEARGVEGSSGGLLERLGSLSDWVDDTEDMDRYKTQDADYE